MTFAFMDSVVNRFADSWIVGQAQPIYSAKALYDYSRQTDEELSFTEDATVQVYDTTDPDWTLVGLNGEYGFAPAIYIESASAGHHDAQAEEAAPPPMPARPQSQRLASPEPIHEPEEEDDDDPLDSPAQNPARALAGIIAQKTGERQAAPAERSLASPPLPARPQYTPEESEDEAPPPMPSRPVSHAQSSRSTSRAVPGEYDDDDHGLASPRGFHLYNIHEMISHMGKNKKMPTTLGINAGRGIISISPEKSRDGPQQEWTAEKLTHYSIEGKHVFIELVRPSKSLDLHAGAKDTAKEIVSALGDLAGAVRQEGLREVIAAGTGGTGQKKGTMLYDFMAQGDDEVTVASGDEVIVLDDAKSEEWWMVRRLKNGKEGVVPSSYVEVTGTLPTASSSYTGVNAGRSVVEQNRLEEERITKEGAERDRQRRKQEDARAQEVGPGVNLPARGSSKRDEKTESKSSKPSECRSVSKYKIMS